MSDEKDERFIKYNEAQQDELHKIITRAVQFMKEKFAPALDLLTDESRDKAAIEFLMVAKAEFLLDEKAIEEGYKDAADKIFQERRAAQIEEANQAAALVAAAKAKEDEEKALFLAEAEKARELQKARDLEDAKRLAELRAAQKAVNVGNERAGL